MPLKAQQEWLSITLAVILAHLVLIWVVCTQLFVQVESKPRKALVIQSMRLQPVQAVKAGPSEKQVLEKQKQPAVQKKHVEKKQAAQKQAVAKSSKKHEETSSKKPKIDAAKLALAKANLNTIQHIPAHRQSATPEAPAPELSQIFNASREVAEGKSYAER